ncbi:MAG: tetratricopeptide repeat protein [Alphaproteobacteria bacterium]|nr:tetratricopeptide repeat protein [Alphaproteobacteria bacterium]
MAYNENNENEQRAREFFDKGRAKMGAGNILGASEDFNKATELKPDYAEVYNGRGVAKLISRDLQGALADFDKAIELEPKNAIFYDNRGFAKHKQEDCQGALADFDKAIELDPDYVPAYENRSDVYRTLRNYPQSIFDRIRADWRRKRRT